MILVDRRRLEAIAEAIIETSGYRVPDGPLYAARNPGGLPAFSPSHARNEQGQRVFSSVLDGIQALMFDIEVKMAGKSRARLQPTNTFADFASAFGQPATAAQAWAKFVRRALQDDAITHKTALSYFLGESQ